MKGKAEIQLQDLFDLKDSEKMLQSLNQNEYIFKTAYGKIERLICIEKDEKFELLSERNEVLFNQLKDANERFIKTKQQLRAFESDLKNWKIKAENIETELYLMRKENKRIRATRKFDKTFAIIGLTSCAFGVAVLINYLIGN